MKICHGCKESKTFDCFNNNKAKKDGLQSLCKECSRKHSAEYRLTNDEKIKIWRLKNVDKAKEYSKKYNAANRDKGRERERKWRLNNPEIRKNVDSRRRAKKLSNGVYKISKKELKRLYSSPCFYCGSTNSIHADHVIPISKGGRHSIGNLIPACAKCNMSKGSKLLIEWRGRKSNLK
jgi:5-methylcytosine-specific restriction endonuclease McrA